MSSSAAYLPTSVWCVGGMPHDSMSSPAAPGNARLTDTG